MRALLPIPINPCVRLPLEHLFLRFLLPKQQHPPLLLLHLPLASLQMTRTLSSRVLILQVLEIATSALMAAKLLFITILTIPLNSPIKAAITGNRSLLSSQKRLLESGSPVQRRQFFKLEQSLSEYTVVSKGQVP